MTTPPKLVLIQGDRVALYHGNVQKGLWIVDWDAEEDRQNLVEEVRNQQL